MIDSPVSQLAVLQDIENEMRAHTASPTVELATHIVHAARFILETDAPLDRIKDTADALKRAQMYFEQQRASLSAINTLTAEHIRLLWRLGNELQNVEKQQGARTLSNTGTKFQQVLNELHAPRSSAYRWVSLGKIEPQDLELYFSECDANEREITTAGALNFFTSKIVVDPRDDTSDTPEPPDDYEPSEQDEFFAPVFKRVKIACIGCGLVHDYEIEI